MQQTTDITQFSRWARAPRKPLVSEGLRTAVIYTRVSGKEQAEKNLSLDFQLKTIRSYAEKNGYTIDASFGGTFESAKTDGRKEFQRMLAYIGENKGRISHILVYTIDRFSRSGGAAIKLAEDLRNDLGVTLLAVTQPIDSSNPAGIFQQNIQLLVSEFDNQLRRQRAIAGMKEKFERGIWCIRPPFGYSIIRENGRKQIIINKQGEILRQAFEWKAKGLRNEQILVKLREAGLDLYKQKLSGILRNPFYAGIISTKMLDGRVIEGEHEKLITPELFLSIHTTKKKSIKSGKRAHDSVGRAHLPLKKITRCASCALPFTGYGIHKNSGSNYYYKCRTVGCKCTTAAAIMHERFVQWILQSDFSSDQLQKLQECFSNLQELSSASFAHLWQSAGIDEKLRLQQILFPDGLVYDGAQKQFISSQPSAILHAA